MTTFENNLNMAVFCDLENVALGVRDAKYDSFDIKTVLERLLIKGSIVVKKAYCNWDPYKSFKTTMHEANFELIEIPHVHQSGKNSADIRLVVDALDLCYNKEHINTFVIISGDSNFSPLVSKLRENAKKVIGIGVKQSTSDLLVANCDEFICYDDLVLEHQRNDARRGNRRQIVKKHPQKEGKHAAPTDNRHSEDKLINKEDIEVRRTRAIEIAVKTFDAMISERGDNGKMLASVLKEAIKRRKPDFNESYAGFRTFGDLLEEAQLRSLFSFERNDKSGDYAYRHINKQAEGPLTDAATIAESTDREYSKTTLSRTPEPVADKLRASHHVQREGCNNNQATTQAVVATAEGSPTAISKVASTTKLTPAAPLAILSGPMCIPPRVRSVTTLPPVPTAPGTILTIDKYSKVQPSTVSKPTDRKPKSVKAATATADLLNHPLAKDAVVVPDATASVSRPRRTRKASQEPCA